MLIISTDPAHNLSDAFDQKFTNKPTQIKSVENLFAMEVDPTANESGSGNMFTSMMSAAGAQQDEEGNAEGMDFMKDLMASVPGIDEATSFGEVIKSLDEYNFDLIIFDTAPTGHTLRLLNFPNILDGCDDKQDLHPQRNFLHGKFKETEFNKELLHDRFSQIPIFFREKFLVFL